MHKVTNSRIPQYLRSTLPIKKKCINASEIHLKINFTKVVLAEGLQELS